MGTRSEPSERWTMEVDTMNQLDIRYNQIITNLKKVTTEDLDCREAEPLYLELLEFLKINLNKKDYLAEKLGNRVKNAQQPWEAIQFCMRELKWEVVRNAVLDRRNSTDDPRIISVMNDILAVYEDEWEDADLYKYYSEKDES